MPEIGSIKKKKKKQPKASKSEVVSAYSEEGKSRQRKNDLITRICWIAGIALTLILVVVFVTLALLGKF